MNDAEYLDIILRGYDTHKSCLTDYFETEAKQLNKEKSISFKLFFLRLREVTDRLNNDLTVNLVERQNKLGLAIDNTKNESAKQQYERDFDTLELTCRINLFELTGGKHMGNLFKKDVSLIEENIKKAKENILPEEKETQKSNNPDTSKICNVPNTNDIFRKNFTICDEIKRSYYSMVSQPSERPNNYVGNLWEHNDPFQVNVYGAYPLMNNWEMLEYMIKNNEHESGYYKHFTEQKVFVSLKDYAKGFQVGFDNFFDDVMKERFVTELDKEEKKQAIIDYLSSLPDTGAFSQTINGNDNEIFSGWYNDGIKGGKHYFAWYYLLANHRLFEGYFKERIESHKVNNEENGQSKIIDFTENNFNSNLKSVHDVTAFFTKELKPYADETTIKKFLYLAFQLCQVPQQKFSFQELNYKKKKIMRVFNKFYNDCGKIQNEATKYAGILGDYFAGFETDNVRTNWTK